MFLHFASCVFIVLTEVFMGQYSLHHIYIAINIASFIEAPSCVSKVCHREYYEFKPATCSPL